MFRDLRRKKQALSQEECVRVLLSQKRGVLSLLGDDGYPYGIPIDYVYDQDENAFFFHCAKEGHKNDAIRRCDKASFCVTEGRREVGEWFLRYESVIAFGRVSTVENEDEKRRICDALCDRFGQGQAYKDDEWRKFSGAVACLRFTIEYLSGKSVKEE